MLDDTGTFTSDGLHRLGMIVDESPDGPWKILLKRLIVTAKRYSRALHDAQGTVHRLRDELDAMRREVRDTRAAISKAKKGTDDAVWRVSKDAEAKIHALEVELQDAREGKKCAERHAEHEDKRESERMNSIRDLLEQIMEIVDGTEDAQEEAS